MCVQPLAQTGSFKLLTSRSRKSHDENVAKYGDCDDACHHAGSDFSAKNCSKKNRSHVQLAVIFNQPLVCDRVLKKGRVGFVNCVFDRQTQNAQVRVVGDNTKLFNTISADSRLEAKRVLTYATLTSVKRIMIRNEAEIIALANIFLGRMTSLRI